MISPEFGRGAAAGGSHVTGRQAGTQAEKSGDTRVLRVRGASLHELAPPHSLRNEMTRRWQIESAALAQLPSNVIVRLMGAAEQVEVDRAHSHDLPKCVEALLAEATANDARDDLTVVLARARGDGTLDTGSPR